MIHMSDGKGSRSATQRPLHKETSMFRMRRINRMQEDFISKTDSFTTTLHAGGPRLGTFGIRLT